jgi:tetratricopeptide (TPR) repeat protein
LILGSTKLEQLPLRLVATWRTQLRDFSEALRVDRMRSGNAAVYVLREQFEKFASSPQKVEACETIATCLYQLEQYDDAANWFETAGRLILSEPSLTPAIKALSALEEYEKALECYRREDDDDRFSECSTLIRRLRRACASA